MKTPRRNILIVTITATALFLSTSAYNSNFFEIAKQIEIFTTLFKELNMNYVDDTNPADLMTTAITGMMEDLDPYTRFYNEQDVEKARINNATNNTGIGAQIQTLKDKLVIIEAYKNYAADKAGLKAGDEIIKVNDITVANYKNDATNLLKGTAGSTVTLTYKRQNTTKTVNITRESVAIKAVPHYSMLNATTGYVVLREFSKTASAETSGAIRALKNKGATQLVLDLRGNPGGLLNEAVNVTNLFVPKNTLVVTTKSKIKKYNKTYYTKFEPIDTNMPVVVLIDGKSASASEIVSGALQDMDRAVVIGNRSFGKGLVQRPKPLIYGTQVKVTISRYYTPSGRCIQALDYKNRDEKGNALRVKSENYNAFSTKNGRTVYDGGGIDPDIKMTDLQTNTTLKAIENSSAIFNFVTAYQAKKPNINLDTFTFTDSDFKTFVNYLKTSNFNFETETENTLQQLKQHTTTEQLLSKTDILNLETLINKQKQISITENKALLKQRISHEIIKRYFYSEGLYDYYKTHSAVIKKATEILNNKTKYTEILK